MQPLQFAKRILGAGIEREELIPGVAFDLKLELLLLVVVRNNSRSPAKKALALWPERLLKLLRGDQHDLAKRFLRARESRKLRRRHRACEHSACVEKRVGSSLVVGSSFGGVGSLQLA